MIDLTKSRHYYDYHREMEALVQAGIPGDALPQYFKVRTAAGGRVRRVRHNDVRRPSQGKLGVGAVMVIGDVAGAGRQRVGPGGGGPQGMACRGNGVPQ